VHLIAGNNDGPHGNQWPAAGFDRWEPPKHDTQAWGGHLQSRFSNDRQLQHDSSSTPAALLWDALLP
jgi:hypothetical protein